METERPAQEVFGAVEAPPRAAAAAPDPEKKEDDVVAVLIERVPRWFTLIRRSLAAIKKEFRDDPRGSVQALLIVLVILAVLACLKFPEQRGAAFAWVTSLFVTPPTEKWRQELETADRGLDEKDPILVQPDYKRLEGETKYLSGSDRTYHAWALLGLADCGRLVGTTSKHLDGETDGSYRRAMEELDGMDSKVASRLRSRAEYGIGMLAVEVANDAPLLRARKFDEAAERFQIAEKEFQQGSDDKNGTGRVYQAIATQGFTDGDCTKVKAQLAKAAACEKGVTDVDSQLAIKRSSKRERANHFFLCARYLEQCRSDKKDPESIPDFYERAVSEAESGPTDLLPRLRVAFANYLLSQPAGCENGRADIREVEEPPDTRVALLHAIAMSRWEDTCNSQNWDAAIEHATGSLKRAEDKRLGMIKEARLLRCFLANYHASRAMTNQPARPQEDLVEAARLLCASRPRADDDRKFAGNIGDRNNEARGVYSEACKKWKLEPQLCD